MSWTDPFKARRALMMHQRGNAEGARAEYERLYASGYIAASYLLPYCVLLLREGGEENYQKVKAILKQAEKAPDLDAQRQQELLMDYAVAQYKLGEIGKAIELLEAAHAKTPCGLVYQALGYLYVEAGEKDKALSYNLEALDYDDEDSIVLDNLGQTYYRLFNDPAKARPYFEKAHEIKENQIDTLYFLSRYDLAEGKKQDALDKLELAVQGRFSPLNYVSREQVTAEIEALRGELS